MKKVALSALAALTLSGVAYAETMTLYTDPATGQVFTQGGEGREAMGDFISAKEVYLENQAQDSAIAEKEAKKKTVDVESHASKLKFSGLAYAGYRHTDFRDEIDKGDESIFELRRAYVQLKAYLLEDPKSYFRTTLDMEYTGGEYNVRFKYAYLFLNEILPYTGVELGMAHRPWIDYEEHNSWFYRNIHWTFVEASNSAHLSNSADLGFNFKTDTDYFSSELGVFNGEGYHNAEDGAGNSFEWRATAHILGTGTSGKDHPTTVTYWDASFYGQYNAKSAKYKDDITGKNEDLIWGGLHTVFNMPSFMVAAQYIKSEDTVDGSTPATAYKFAGEGYNAHVVGRFGSEKEYAVFARYDNWTPEREDAAGDKHARRTYIGGASWQQNKNIQWVANVITYDNEAGAIDQKDNSNQYMLTAKIEF
jgi:hypothetical protein